MNFAHGKDDGPITVIVTRIAKKGRIKEFEDWMDGIVHESLKFEGHLGVNIIRPVEKSRPEYVIIFRFNTLDNLLKWEKSQERKDWLEKSKNVVEGEDKVQKFTGLEFWFTPRSPHRAKHEANNNEDSIPTMNVPPRYKMVMVTVSILFVLLHTDSSDKAVDRIPSITIERPSRCNRHGASYDILDNAVCHKVAEGLAI
jgi:uncharacterized protein